MKKYFKRVTAFLLTLILSLGLLSATAFADGDIDLSEIPITSSYKITSFIDRSHLLMNDACILIGNETLGPLGITAKAGAELNITIIVPYGYVLADSKAYINDTEIALTFDPKSANYKGSFVMPEKDAAVVFTSQLTGTFDDVAAGLFYYGPVYWASVWGITTGTSANLFSPDDLCSRGQAVTFLWRYKDSPEPTLTENPFTDVSEDAYYYKAVLWASEKGITTGTTATTFSPDTPCLRGQVVTFLYRMANGSKPDNIECSFTDVTENDFFYDPVLWAVDRGITTGTTDTTFSPNDYCLRGQFVTFLYRHAFFGRG